MDRNTAASRDEAQHAAELLEFGDAFLEVDRDWRIVRVNRNQERLSQKPRTETLGRVLWEVWPASAEPSTLYWREYNRCMEGRVPVQFEEHYPPLDLWTGVTAYPVSTGGIAVFFRDITATKRAEQALRVSKAQLEAERARLEAIVQTIPTGLIMLDERGAMVLENDEWKRTWAGNGNALVDSALDYARNKGFRPDTGERIAAEDWPCAVSLKKGEPTRGVVLDIERFDGTRGTIIVSSAPIRDESGRVVGAVAANQDITELRATQARLEEADRRKDEFLGMLSHELRNPLAPIRNALYILDRAQPGGQQAERAKDIANRQVAHLTRLVDDLLDVTRIARGKVELRREQVDLAALVRRTAEDYRPLMQDRGLDLDVDVPPGSLASNGDAARLTQILGNLLNNAAKFTPAGGRVTLALRPEGDRAVVHVRDTGPGISPDVLPTLFEPFTQGKQTLARSEGGLGLGLSLVKGLVGLHGGEVTATTTPGRGAEFVVRLPLALAASTHAARGGSGAGAPAARRRRVLVIDDNHDAAETVAELARMLGHEAEVAHDGLAGLARAAHELPDVVLCDIGLPGMDGYEFARRFRSLASEHGVRLVALSGYAQPEDVEKAVESGFDAHVAKPPDPGMLDQILGT